MKLIIDISDDEYNVIIANSEYYKKQNWGSADVWDAVKNGTPYEERPQGEWVDEGQYAEGHSEHAYTCKNCKTQIIEKPTNLIDNRFCKHCGADMRKGSAE